MRRLPTAAVTVGLVLTLVAPRGAIAGRGLPAQASPLPANVLLLHSYHKGFAWSDNVTRGVEEVLTGGGRPVDLTVEFMDTKRRNDDEHYRNLLALFRHKFPPGLFNGVITADDDALIFALRHRDALFPGVPIVFSGFSHRPGEQLAGQRGVTGIVETHDIGETIELALGLHPQTRRVVTINDLTTTGLARQKQIDAAATALAARGIVVETLADVTAKQLEDRLRDLKASDIVFLQAFNRDSAGRVFNPEGIMALVSRSCGRPVYTIKEEYLGLGVVGGFLTAGRVHGQAAARLQLRILGGDDPAGIPVVENSINLPMFDDRQLQRFEIAPDHLPAGSVRIEVPVPFYVMHRKLVAAASGAFVLLLAAIAVLTASVRTRRRAEEDLAITLLSIGDAVIATDREGRVSRINPVAEHLVGWPARDAAGRHLGEIFRTAGSGNGIAASLLEAAVGRGESVSLAEGATLVSRDGTERRISDSASPIRAHGGVIRGMVVVFRDVSEQSAMEERLRQTQKMETIGRLAGGVAHDFNNLLGGIIGYADLLIAGLAGDRRLHGYAERIVETADRAAGLTRNLLAFSRKRQLQDSHVDLHQSLRDVIGILEQTIDRRILIQTRFEAAAPFVKGDLSQIQSAILNLGVNARDAMPEGGTITIATADVALDGPGARALPDPVDPGRYVEITVSDTGAGMEPEVQEHIFEPFFSTKPVGKGTGLGLPAVYGTVRAHRGTIQVRSAPGAGSAFRILLPTTSEVAPEVAPRPPEASAGTGCILVVDDEKIIRTMASDMLRELGYEVLLAEDGDEGIEVFRRERERISLVILDVIMPKRSGPDSFRALKALDPGVRVLISSGFDFDTASRSLVSEGLAGFLQKPFRYSELSETIAAALRSVPAP